jgi:hypothetical protein
MPYRSWNLLLMDSESGRVCRLEASISRGESMGPYRTGSASNSKVEIARSESGNCFGGSSCFFIRCRNLSSTKEQTSSVVRERRPISSSNTKQWRSSSIVSDRSGIQTSPFLRGQPYVKRLKQSISRAVGENVPLRPPPARMYRVESATRQVGCAYRQPH